MSKSEIGRKVAELRKQTGLSQDGLAYLCKMNVRSIQRIEAGNVQPRPYTIRILSEVLDYKFVNENNKRKKVDLKRAFQNIMSRLSIFEKNEGESEMEKESFLKQITKSQQDRKVAGISGGLGQHTSVPAWLWRVIFVASTFVYGIGIILYVLFWIFMPDGTEQAEADDSSKNNWLNQLTKSEKDKKVGGICGGLGDNSVIPSWCWRIIFVASSLIYGIGIGLYILLWIFMPSGKSKKQENFSFA